MKYNGVNPSQLFKDLYISMVAFNEKDRPNNIEQIIQDPWLKEIRDININHAQQFQLENQIQTEFNLRENEINQQNQQNEPNHQNQQNELDHQIQQNAPNLQNQ